MRFNSVGNNYQPSPLKPTVDIEDLGMGEIVKLGQMGEISMGQYLGEGSMTRATPKNYATGRHA
jgi:hypothetical protein